MFWGLVMYDNELKPSKLKFKPKVKLNDNKYRTSRTSLGLLEGKETSIAARS